MVPGMLRLDIIEKARKTERYVNMTNAEALILAHQVGMNVNSADELWDRCGEIGYTIALEHDSGCWIILYGNTVMARCY